MPNYRRLRVAGGCYFFTLATRDRAPMLTQAPVRASLRQAIVDIRQRWPFVIEAWVLLPDHLHCLWTLPPDDADYSRRWSTIKRLTTQQLGESIWQPRFWEHAIRDERDFENHCHYVHFNPVKHGLVDHAVEWPYSTFHRYLREGVYEDDWSLGPDGDLDLG